MSETLPAIQVEQYLHQLRDSKNMAKELGVSRNYILAMKHNGFRMPGGKASIWMAREFLSSFHEFQVTGRPPASPPQSVETSDKPHDSSSTSARRRPTAV